MSRKDLLHVLTALRDLSGGDPATAVGVPDIAEAIGRAPNDMRTALNLQSLSDDGLVRSPADSTWALTPRGIDWLTQDDELSDR
jgi:hypothetical protein